ncbi:MAG: cytochrome c maturation protein CcmE [Limnochordales bacterium]|nr:cytochrome c maturation protein CcmE [Limnochordales bacterium]
MDPRKRKVTAALALVGVILVYLIATAASNTTMYYLTVDEALARRDSLQGRWVRIAGQVPGDTIQWDSRDFMLTFDVVENGHRVPAVYRGVRPDNLIDGTNVVLEGTFNASGVFEVDRLLVQCVSKYEAADRPDGAAPHYEEIDGVLYESYSSGWRGGR